MAMVCSRGESLTYRRIVLLGQQRGHPVSHQLGHNQTQQVTAGRMTYQRESTQ